MDDFELEAVLRRELLPGEQLAWTGRPDPSRMKAAFAMWFFAIPWTAFALFWETMALSPWFASRGAPDGMTMLIGVIFPLFGVPFVLIGFWMLAMPFRARKQAAVTIFGLTDRRILKVSAGRKRESASVLFSQMGPIDVTTDAQGYGTLRIETGTHVDSDGDRHVLRFEVPAVPNVARLEELLLQARTR
jgi:hypothetical protein